MNSPKPFHRICPCPTCGTIGEHEAHSCRGESFPGALVGNCRLQSPPPRPHLDRVCIVCGETWEEASICPT